MAATDMSNEIIITEVVETTVETLNIFMFRSGPEMEASRDDLTMAVAAIFPDVLTDRLTSQRASFLLYMALFKSKPHDGSEEAYLYDPLKVKFFHDKLTGENNTVVAEAMDDDAHADTELVFSDPKAWCSMQLAVLIETRLLFTLHTVAMDQHRTMSWREMTLLMPVVNSYMRYTDKRIVSSLKVPFMQLWTPRTLYGGLAPRVIPAAIGYICEYALHLLLKNNGPVNPNREWTAAALHVANEFDHGETTWKSGPAVVSTYLRWYNNPVQLMRRARHLEARFQADDVSLPLSPMQTLRASDTSWIRTLGLRNLRDNMDLGPLRFEAAHLTGLLQMTGGKTGMMQASAGSSGTQCERLDEQSFALSGLGQDGAGDEIGEQTLFVIGHCAHRHLPSVCLVTYFGVNIKAQPEKADSLPPGWSIRTDSRGRRYYVDKATRTTTWIHPITKMATPVPIKIKIESDGSELDGSDDESIGEPNHEEKVAALARKVTQLSKDNAKVSPSRFLPFCFLSAFYPFAFSLLPACMLTCVFFFLR